MKSTYNGLQRSYGKYFKKLNSSIIGLSILTYSDVDISQEGT